MNRVRVPRPGGTRHHLLLCLALLLPVLAGCTQDGGEAASAEVVVTEDAAEGEGVVEEGAADADPSGEGPDDHDEVEERDPRLPLPDIEEVVLRTPAEGVGPHPVLTWEPVPAAQRYHVSVVDDEGRTGWAWTTEATEVILGGYEEPPPHHVRGPRLHEPMYWHVLARDAEDRVIAQSGLRPIAP